MRRPLHHHHVEQLFSNYRHLTPDEQAEIQEHLKTCADCRNRLEAFRQMDRLLKQSIWQTPKRRLRDGFYAAIDAERTKRQPLWVGKRPFISRVAGQAASLALLVVMVAAVWILMRQLVLGPTETPDKTVEQLTSVPSATTLPGTKALPPKMTITEPGGTDTLNLSENGHFLAVAQGSQVQIWSTSSGRLLESLDIGAESAVDIAITPNDVNLVVRTSAGRLQRWLVDGGTRLADNETTPIVTPNLPFATHNIHLAVATADNRIELWGMATGELITTFANHDDALTDLRFSADGKMLLAGDSSGVVHLWDLNTHTRIQLTGHRQPVVALAISQRGDQIAAGYADGQVRVWSHKDVSGTTLQTLPSRAAGLLHIHFADDGNTFFRLLQDGTVEYWPVGDAQPNRVLSTAALQSGEFAPLSQGLIVAGIAADGSANIWEILD